MIMNTPVDSNTPLSATSPTSTPPTSTSTPSETVSAPPAPNTQAKRFRTAAERKAQLERDPWIDPTKVTPKKVRCLGCGNDVKLDMRAGADYYPAPWNKHKVACAYIKEGRRKDDEENSEKMVRGGNKVATADQPATLPVGWTTASLEGGGLTMKSSGDLLRAMGNQGELFWGSRPSSPRT